VATLNQISDHLLIKNKTGEIYPAHFIDKFIHTHFESGCDLFYNLYCMDFISRNSSSPNAPSSRP